MLVFIESTILKPTRNQIPWVLNHKLQKPTLLVSVNEYTGCLVRRRSLRKSDLSDEQVLSYALTGFSYDRNGFASHNSNKYTHNVL